ncbi:putative fibroblast growth factor-binding protein 3 [Scophthalmus maximus]|uniref:Putative fibroblast growth factor-binding protein 3 n=1 Tax=Scophthalmus maximus TaxID=52904 RepID=A0A2U9CDR1_SCOMX|nr:putative fibroblast growth factor-binding protein 3 [Scophthalmus maximus]
MATCFSPEHPFFARADSWQRSGGERASELNEKEPGGAGSGGLSSDPDSCTSLCPPETREDSPHSSRLRPREHSLVTKTVAEGEKLNKNSWQRSGGERASELNEKEPGGAGSGGLSSDPDSCTSLCPPETREDSPHSSRLRPREHSLSSQYWKQLVGKLKKRQNACDGEKVLKAKTCKKAPAEAHMKLAQRSGEEERKGGKEGGKRKGASAGKAPDGGKAERKRKNEDEEEQERKKTREERTGFEEEGVMNDMQPVERYCSEGWSSVCSFFVKFFEENRMRSEDV